MPGSVAQAADGTWSIAYDILVENTGSSRSAASTRSPTRSTSAPASISAGDLRGDDGRRAIPDPVGDGTGDLVVDRYLGDRGIRRLYRITVSGIVLDGPALTPAQTACPRTTADGAFNNAAILTVAGVDDLRHRVRRTERTEDREDRGHRDAAPRRAAGT